MNKKTLMGIQNLVNMSDMVIIKNIVSTLYLLNLQNLMGSSFYIMRNQTIVI